MHLTQRYGTNVNYSMSDWCVIAFVCEELFEDTTAGFWERDLAELSRLTCNIYGQGILPWHISDLPAGPMHYGGFLCLYDYTYWHGT